MALFDWGEKYSVTINEFDIHHKKLIELLNNLHDAMSQGKSREILGKLIKELADYTVFHFGAEEKYMKQFAYAEYDRHKKEHEAFVQKVTDFQNGFSAGKLTLSLEVMNFLRDWVSKHILETDKKYGPFLKEKGVK